jgi:hypothetical protein
MRFIVSLHCSVGDANGRECVLKKSIYIIPKKLPKYKFKINK